MFGAADMTGATRGLEELGLQGGFGGDMFIHKKESFSVKSQIRDCVAAGERTERTKAMKRPDAGRSHDRIEDSQARLRRIDVRVALAEERERRPIDRHKLSAV